MLSRALVVVVALSVPAEAQAAGYVVHRGDTLGAIAYRSHLSVYALARANGIRNPNAVRAGRVLFVPRAVPRYTYGTVRRYAYYRRRWVPRYRAARYSTSVVSGYRQASGYRVQWGDTLSGLAVRYHTSVAALRSMNPSLGTYLLAGQTLNVCGSCAAPPAAGYFSPVRTDLVPYAARPVSMSMRIVPRYPAYAAPRPLYRPAPLSTYRAAPAAQMYSPLRPAVYSGYQARALIAAYARQYGLETSLPLAIGAQESGFQQSAISGAGAVGVMQVEPNTARQISTMLGRPVNLYSMDDNIHAGVFWLAHLVAQYGGNERLAAAAYYQGGSALATRGFYNDTVRYVNHAMTLKTNFGG